MEFPSEVLLPLYFRNALKKRSKDLGTEIHINISILTVDQMTVCNVTGDR